MATDIIIGWRQEYACLKDMAWKHTVYHVNEFDTGHTGLKQK